MRKKGSECQLESRRWTAIRLYNAGKSLPVIAKKMKASRSSVYCWIKAYKQNGLAGLRIKKIPGRPQKLDGEDYTRLSFVLGQKLNRFSKGIFTLEEIRDMIKKEFKINYHPSHISRVMRRIKWRYEKFTMYTTWKTKKMNSYNYIRGGWEKKESWF